VKEIKGLKVLDRNDFIKFCPSFYATAPKTDVSDKYQFLNTRDMAVQLWESGWMPVYAREAKVVDPLNRGLTRHVVRWAHPDYRVGGERIELVGVNSHNRASAFSFYAGIFRLICSNGLISQTSDFGSFQIKHLGVNLHVQVAEAIGKIAESATGIAARMQEFKEIELSPIQQDAFAAGAHGYMWEEPDTAPVRPDQLLRPRRLADSQNGDFYHSRPKRDLWTTFNTIQENLMKGGIQGRNSKGNRMKTRKIHSIDKDVKLNQALWIMAEKMAESA